MQALRSAHLIGLVLLGLSFPARAQQPVAVETGQSQRARASFTSEIIDREPVDRLTEFSNDGQVIYFHTELLGLGGSEIIHRWEFNGQTMAEVPFRVGAGRGPGGEGERSRRSVSRLLAGRVAAVGRHTEEIFHQGVPARLAGIVGPGVEYESTANWVLRMFDLFRKEKA